MKPKRIKLPSALELSREPRLLTRLCGNVKVEASGCWRWLGYTDDKGYGQIRALGRRCWVHRVSYAAFVGPIPAGMTVHHKESCLNPSCINPDHLELKTNVENVAEANARRRRKAGAVDIDGIPV